MRKLVLVGILLSLLALGGAGRVDAVEHFSAAESEQFLDAMTLFAQGRVEEGVRYMKPLAEAGDASAQYIVGKLYYVGYGVAKDRCEALKWYELAAAQDHAGAIKEIGSYYHYSICLPENYDEAAGYYRRAAALGEEAALLSLSLLYREEDWDGYNPRLSFEAVKRAWDSSDESTDDVIAEIAMSLGNHYRYGKGVDENFGEAERYYLLAANHGILGAQASLAGMYGQRGSSDDLSGPAGQFLLWHLVSYEQMYTLKGSTAEQLVAEIGADKYAEYLEKAREKLRQIAAAPGTAIGRAVAWCGKAMAGSYDCLSNAFNDHDACKSPIVNEVNEFRYVESEIYNACRHEIMATRK